MKSTAFSRSLSVAVLSLACLDAGVQAKVGVTSTTAGEPLGTPPAQRERVLRVGSDVFANEAVRTSTNDRAHLLFNDGTALTIGPNSQITIDRYVYDPDKGTGTMALTATRGVFRLVGGKITKSSEAEIRTPVGTIGIRGGITVVNITPAKTDAYFLFGTRLTIRNGSGEQVLTRPGSKVEVAPGQAPGSPRLATPSDLAAASGALEGQALAPGAAPASGAPAPSAIERGMAQSNVGNVNSAQRPGALRPPAIASPQASPAALVQVANAASTDVTARSEQPFTQPPPPDQGTTGAITSPTPPAPTTPTITTTPPTPTTPTTPTPTTPAAPTTVTIGGEGRLLTRPEFGTVTATQTSISAPRNPSNNTALSSAMVVDGSQLVVSAQTGATFTLPWSPGTSSTLTAANTSSSLGPVNGYGLVSASGDFAYVFAPTGDPTKVSRVFGGTPTRAGTFPISGFAAHTLWSLDSPAALGPTVFVDPVYANHAAVAGAFNTPLYSVYSANAHLGAIPGSPDPNQRALAMQASLGIVGQGSSQSSYFGFFRGTYITDYTKSDTIGFAGILDGMLRASATGRTVRFTAGASSMETQAGTAIYGPRADYMVIGPDSLESTAVNNTVITPAAALSLAQGSPFQSYYPIALAVPASLPAGVGTQRTTRSMNGYAGANVETVNFAASGAYSEHSLRNTDPANVTLATSASSNRAQAMFRLTRTDDPLRDLTAQFGGLFGNARSASVFIDDRTVGLSQSPAVGTTYDGGNPSFGRLYAVTQATVPVTSFLPSGVTFCSCEYLSWGYWAGEVGYTSGPRANQTDRMHLATWVAGELSSVASIPNTGTATYSGHIIGNVTNGNNRYLAAGAFQHGWNFATRTGSVSVTNFDGTNYSGASSAPTTARDFAASISGAGRTGSLNGSFFRSPTDAVKYQAGSFAITGTNYRATGIFAGQR